MRLADMDRDARKRAYVLMVWAALCAHDKLTESAEQTAGEMLTVMGLSGKLLDDVYQAAKVDAELTLPNHIRVLLDEWMTISKPRDLKEWFNV